MKQTVVLLIILFLVPLTASAQDFCEGNFDYDDDQDGTDAVKFKTDFGRHQYNNSCPPDGPAPVPRTGQTTEYTPGDDGGLEKGVEWPNPRFTDNLDGTVADNLTGLIWLKNANCFGIRNWWEALTDCNVLAHGQCGLTDSSSGGDWRLPNLFDLESLRDMKYYQPPLSNSAGTGQWTHGDPFTNLVTDGSYWTSTTFPSDSNQAFILELLYGYVIAPLKSTPMQVWPVRGGH